MLLHPIGKLTDAGIDEILVVTGTEHVGDVVALLGSGADLGCRITYRVQEEAGGIAQALSLAEHFAAGGPVCVVLGDNLFADPLGPEVERFQRQGGGARILLKEVPDPERFGVARVEGDRVVEILEKPADPPTHKAVTGIYFYDAGVYEIIGRQRPSARGELEITDVNNAYIGGRQMTWGALRGWWTDAGTFPSYHRANRYFSEGAA